MLSNRKIGGVIIVFSIMTPFSYLSICNHDSCQDNIHYYSNLHFGPFTLICDDFESLQNQKSGKNRAKIRSWALQVGFFND